MPVASDLLKHRFAAVDANAHPRPIRMLVGETGEFVLQRQSGASSPQGVIRLVPR